MDRNDETQQLTCQLATKYYKLVTDYDIDGGDIGE